MTGEHEGEKGKIAALFDENGETWLTGSSTEGLYIRIQNLAGTHTAGTETDLFMWTELVRFIWMQSIQI